MALPIWTTAAAVRSWRNAAANQLKTVGFVPTMGALHAGHLSLVRRSLAQNDLTVISIFVNPAQFAPHEDLATYPHTLQSDLAALSRISVGLRSPSALFLPSAAEMYPSGISQDVCAQRGTFVEVAGFGHQMEGASRPTFFRGVATVVTKLFNIIQPNAAYFGQKDIQQALVLRRLTRDLFLPFPPSPSHVHIVPTERVPTTGLALSSRNARLTHAGFRAAPALYAALCAARDVWRAGGPVGACLEAAERTVSDVATQCMRAQDVGESSGKGDGAHVRLDYVAMNDAETFAPLDTDATMYSNSDPTARQTVILSGAMWVDDVRLIDNVILGDDSILS